MLHSDFLDKYLGDPVYDIAGSLTRFHSSHQEFTFDCAYVHKLHYPRGMFYSRFLVFLVESHYYYENSIVSLCRTRALL